MCGRFTIKATVPEVVQRFKVAQLNFEFKPRFNVAPSQEVPVITLDKSGERVLDSYGWGLVPSWAKNPKMPKPANARDDTVASSGMFRDAFRNRRCLMPADGFYEWVKGTKTKTPHYIHFPDSQLFAFAGIWEEHQGERTCALITTEPNQLMKDIHNRMPVILPYDLEEAWLDPTLDVQAALAMLRPYRDGELEEYIVGQQVGNTRFDSADMINPVSQDGQTSIEF